MTHHRNNSPTQELLILEFSTAGSRTYPVDFKAQNTQLLGPVVQTLDSAVHWINHYPRDNSIGFASFYPPDRDLSGGQRYPSFEQLGPVSYSVHKMKNFTVTELFTASGHFSSFVKRARHSL